MEATKMDKLSDSDLTALNEMNDSISNRQQNGQITIDQALDEAEAVHSKLTETFDPSVQVSPLRRFAWEQSNKLIRILKSEKFEQDKSKGPKFEADSFLDIEARSEIQAVRQLVNTMTLNGKKTPSEDELKFFEKETGRDGSVSDEQYVLIRISMLSNYGKYIHSNHPEMKKLRQAYHDKALKNYSEYAKSQYRSTNRDKALADKVSSNLKSNRYTDQALAQAVINILQPVL
jgi:hypothetical protein